MKATLSCKSILLSLTSLFVGFAFLENTTPMRASQSVSDIAGKSATVSTAPNSPPVRATDGLDLLRTALAKLGDPNSLLAAQSCDISEGVTPTGGSSTPVDLTIDADNYLVTAHTIKSISQSGSLTPVTIRGKLFNLSPRLRLSHFEPAAATQWLARAIKRPSISVGSVVQKSVDGKSFLTVRLTDTTNAEIAVESAQVWYFDPSTYMPVRVDYKLLSAARSGLAAPTHVLIHSFHAFSGVLFPSTMSTFIGETPSATIAVSSAACSTQLHPVSYFDVSGKSIQ